MNAAWHKSHPMPASASPQQRLRWHLAHAKACGCRSLTASMLEELRRRARATAAAPRLPGAKKERQTVTTTASKPARGGARKTPTPRTGG